MAVPSSATYSVDAKVAAHTAFRDLIDADTDPGYITIRDEDDILLAQIPLESPSGTVNGSTGQLVFDIAGRDESADESGEAAYAEFCDGAGLVHLAMPCKQGGAPDSGFMVLNTLTIVQGGPVEVLSAVIG
jgi:hypothetical protein